MAEKLQRAVILGSGFGGLMVAKVLSEHFKEVVVIERDSQELSEQLGYRKGLPQCSFNHALIPMGLRAVETLFPQFGEEVLKNGGHVDDMMASVRFHYDGVDKPRFKSDYKLYFMGRPMYDKVVRDLIKKECSNVSFKYDTDVIGLISEGDTITGAKLKSRVDKKESTITGDLIVDTTGPHARSEQWLEEIGFDRPPHEEVEINYIQVSYRARWREGYNPDWGLTVFKKDGIRKGGYFMRLEDDQEGKPQWMFALVTHLGEPLEKNMDSYKRLCTELQDEAFYEEVKKATPLTEMGQYKLPKIRRKFFSKMKRTPKNLVVLGDAQVTWAPHTGLGVAMAAVNSLVLKDVIDKNGFKNISNNYFEASEESIDRIWTQNIAESVIPMIGTPKPSLYVRILCWYKYKLASYTDNDPYLWRETAYFFFNERRVPALFKPKILFRMLMHAIGVYK